MLINGIFFFNIHGLYVVHLNSKIIILCHTGKKMDRIIDNWIFNYLMYIKYIVIHGYSSKNPIFYLFCVIL